MKNLHIRTRLIILLVAVTLVAALLRLEGAWRAHELAEEVDDLYRFRIVPMEALKDISDETARVLVRVPAMVRTGMMSVEQAAAALDAGWKNIDAAWGRYEPGIDSLTEQQQARALRASLDAAGALSLRGRERLLQGDLAGFEQLAAKDLLPQAEDVTRLTTALVELNFDLARQTDGRVAAGYRQSLVLSGLLALGMLAAIMALGVSVIRSISQALRKVSLQLNALAEGEGNLALRIPVVGDDEITDLSKAFNGLMDKLQGLVRRVQESGIKVATSATELAASARQQEATVAQQAASTNEVESAARQIAHTARELATTMHDFTGASQQALDLAATGRDNLSRMEQTIRQVDSASSSIGDRLAAINAKATNITSIVTTITKVADQTNLLSLNAAIEAAKAGEFGQGFGVVAREIRRLADQTAVATLDIEQTVKEMQVAVSSGVMSMEKFSAEVRATVDDVSRASAQLGAVIDQVNVLGPRFLVVGEGMATQSQGAQQISTAMTELSQSASQTADALRESSRAIAQLNEAARELQKEVARFAGTGA
jgi:methyl-accepting chemotaxis protein WspA